MAGRIPTGIPPVFPGGNRPRETCIDLVEKELVRAIPGIAKKEAHKAAEAAVRVAEQYFGGSTNKMGM